jgi:TonB family protein
MKIRALLVLVALVGCKKPVPVVVSPQAIENPMPSPEKVGQTAAAKAGKNGATKVGYCVSVEGKTEDVTVLEPFEPEFDALAVATVQSWRFEPATRDGQPYLHCTDVRIELRQ